MKFYELKYSNHPNLKNKKFTTIFIDINTTSNIIAVAFRS